MKLHEDLEKVLISEEEIKRRVAEMGRQITEDYKDDPEPLVLVCILKGSVVFLMPICCGRSITIAGWTS